MCGLEAIFSKKVVCVCHLVVLIIEKCSNVIYRKIEREFSGTPYGNSLCSGQTMALKVTRN